MFVGIKKQQHIFMIIVIYTVEKCIFIFTNHFNSKIFTKICYALILVTILTVWLVFLQFLCLFPCPGWWFIGYIQFRLCFSFFVLQCSCIICNCLCVRVCSFIYIYICVCICVCVCVCVGVCAQKWRKSMTMCICYLSYCMQVWRKSSLRNCLKV